MIINYLFWRERGVEDLESYPRFKRNYNLQNRLSVYVTGTETPKCSISFVHLQLTSNDSKVELSAVCVIGIFRERQRSHGCFKINFMFWATVLFVFTCIDKHGFSC